MTIFFKFTGYLNVMYSSLKWFIIITLICIVTWGFNWLSHSKPILSKNASNFVSISNLKPYTLTSKIKSAKSYAKTRNLDTGLALLIDYKIHSGKKRAFLVDLSLNKPIDSFLVSHGCGLNPWGGDYSKEKPTFSNEPESHCSSLGHFKIGIKGKSSWGIFIKYFLHGLDSSNNNALKRQIVLHGWSEVSDSEIYPEGTPEGWGCPAFSNAVMTLLDSAIQTRSKPILLWSFN